MSEPIQSIAQNNYILHNIDAKKLYVQEPLFTANSGDAVYVGWRPDETVLYSGQATGNLTLSDNPLNYERLLVTFNASTGNTDMGAGSEIFEPDKTHLSFITPFSLMWRSRSRYCCIIHKFTK